MVSTLTPTGHLQRRAGGADEGLEVRLEPGASLRRGLRSIRLSQTHASASIHKPKPEEHPAYLAAVRVEAGRRAVAGAVALASGLDPDDRVDEGRAGAGRRARAEAGALDVAPVAPGLAEVLLAGAALVDDEARGEALLLEDGAKSLRATDTSAFVSTSGGEATHVDVVDLVVVRVALGAGVGGGSAERIVVGDVGGEAADERGGAGVLEDGGEHLGGGAQVGGPAEPASMASIEVHVHADGRELLDGVVDAGLCKDVNVSFPLGKEECDAYQVGGLSVGALLDVQVGDEVSQGVGLDDGNDADIGEFCDITGYRRITK